MTSSTPRLRTSALLTDTLDEAAGSPVVVRSRFHPDRGIILPNEGPPIGGALFGCWLWRRSVDPLEVLSAVARRLAPGARIRFCEPSPGPAVVPGLGALTTGYRFDRDLPAIIRQSGLIVTTIDRFPIAPGAWFCAGIAEWNPAGDAD